jgi:VWFA-related protein
MKRIVSVVAIALSMGPAALARQSQASPSQTPAIKSTGEEVLLDVVVRDKKGRAVNDLKSEDFQILDNGEPKKILSFRLVQGEEAIGAGGARTQLDPLRQIRLLTMIFQCWNNDARRLARDAAVDLIKSELPQNVYIAVMTIDHKLEVLQAFTNDRNLLRQGIERANRSQNTDFSSDTEVVRKQLEQMLGSPNGGHTAQQQIDDTNTALQNQGRAIDTTAMANIAMAQMVLQMLETEQSNAMVEGGRTNIYALLDAVKEQYRLPGRKTVLYFSEGGFAIPQGMEEPFRNVISIANRSNVSIYALDTRGLTTISTSSDSMETLRKAGQSAADQMRDEPGKAVRPDQAKVFDTSIQSTRANTQNTLASLAESTGGSLIANTNDFRGPLRRLTEDILSYYEITYAPEIKSYDGTFRKIAVRMNSNDLRVQTRSGYVALPTALASKGAPLHAYEFPLLAALDSAEPPHAFSYHSQALHFRGARDQSVCELVVDVPLGALTFNKNTAGQFESRLSYVALLKDGKGEVTKKFQNDLPISAPEGKLAALKASHFIYTEHFDLASGHYTLETAVLDGSGNKISARKTSIVMPEPSTALGLSSVSIVRNTKEKETTTAFDDPMLVGSKVVSPMLSPVLKKTEADAISFYMVIYPSKRSGTSPQLTMEFSKDGQVLGSGSPQLTEPDKDGRIRYVATAPLASLPPGEFMIRFIVKQGSEVAEEPVTFTLQ